MTPLKEHRRWLLRAALAGLCIFALPGILSSGPEDTPVVRTIVVSKGEIPFRLKPAQAKSNYAAACKGDLCYCQADIEYLQIENSAALQPITAINRRLQADAQSAVASTWMLLIRSRKR